MKRTKDFAAAARLVREHKIGITLSEAATACDVSIEEMAAVLQQLSRPRLSDGMANMDKIGEDMKATIAKMSGDAGDKS